MDNFLITFCVLPDFPSGWNLYKVFVSQFVRWAASKKFAKFQNAVVVNSRTLRELINASVCALQTV